MRFLGVTLERTTLAEVVKLVGPADIRHNGGDAHASQYSLCYRGHDGTTLVFGSHGEMGESDHHVTELQIVGRPDLADYSGDERYRVPPDAKPACSRSALVSRSLALGGTLRLGATRDSVARILGADATQDGRISVSRSISVGQDFETMRTVEVIFESNRAVALRAYQVTSN
jgi:hypothetical protein